MNIIWQIVTNSPPLWKHQLECCRRAAEKHNFALLFEMGAGKTRTVIEILKHRYEVAGRELRTLIFTAPVVVPQFKGEWLKFSNLKSRQVLALQGPGKKRLNDFLKGGASVAITNYEALLNKELYQAFLDWAPEAVVWDESQKIKSPSTARSKLANDLSNPYDKKTKTRKPKPHTYLLTGTPVLNSPMDLFQQMKVMDGGETFGDNFFAFRAQYFRDRNINMPKASYFPNWQPMTLERDGVDAIKVLNEKLAAVSMRVLKSECLDLPPELDIKIECEMSPQQAKHYKEMKNDLITYLGDKACVASMALTKSLRLMQLASGFLSLDGDEGPIEMELEDTPKLEALEALLEEICADPKNKAIVWTCWKRTYVDIGAACTRLGLNFVQVHGGITESKKEANISAFRTDPSVRVFIGNPQSGGVGLSLVEARYSIRYSRTFSLEHWLQSRARNHRGGSKEAGHKSIVHYELICKDTIDSLCLEKLSQKVDLSQSLLANLRSELQNQGD